MICRFHSSTSLRVRRAPNTNATMNATTLKPNNGTRNPALVIPNPANTTPATVNAHNIASQLFTMSSPHISG